MSGLWPGAEKQGCIEPAGAALVNPSRRDVWERERERESDLNEAGAKVKGHAETHTHTHTGLLP